MWCTRLAKPASRLPSPCARRLCTVATSTAAAGRMPETAHHDVEILLRAEVGGKSALVDHVIGQSNAPSAATTRCLFHGRCSRRARYGPGRACPRWSGRGSAESHRSSRAIMAPVAPRSAAVTGWPARETPITMDPSLSAQIGSARCQPENRHDLRGRGDHKARLAVALLHAPACPADRRSQHTRRRARSFMSIARGHVICAGSRSSALPKKRCESTMAASRLCAAVMA